ncbi:MAG TPA: transcriptional repressor [Planctomycetaceae bacterium]|nr:transcriptional repressor [Planctomycetaceae bacterium]
MQNRLGEKVKDRMNQFESLCREKGIPVTVQRRVILQTLLQRRDHPTADQIFEDVRKQIPDISRTTVYRVLEALVGLGVIRRVHSMGNAVRYDGNIDRHHHLVCRECGRMADWESPALNNLPMPKEDALGFHIDDYTIQFTGICAECRRQLDHEG